MNFTKLTFFLIWWINRILSIT